MATAKVAERRSLSENLSPDTCVVGAGIAGMTTAYLLAREGESVVVLDDGAIGGGMTGRTTAHWSTPLMIVILSLRSCMGRKAPV